jgi:peptidoglycan/LPS O-acetylase OafA/YrhL
LADTVIVHPNRDKPTSKATRATCILLFLASAVLVAIVTIGGWSSLQGAQIVAIAYVLVFCVMAYFTAKWNRGVLPVGSALAILLLVVAAIAAPAWFARDHSGFDNPGLPPSLLGLLTAIIVPVELLLILFAMRGFTQQWNVEVEVSRDEYESDDFRARDYEEDDDEYEPQPQT